MLRELTKRLVTISDVGDRGVSPVLPSLVCQRRVQLVPGVVCKYSVRCCHTGPVSCFTVHLCLCLCGAVSLFLSVSWFQYL